MNDFSCPFCNKPLSTLNLVTYHVGMAHSEFVKFRPVIHVNPYNESYAKLAKRAQLPQIANGELELLNNESVITAEKVSWANAGAFNAEGKIDWLLRYQSLLYGAIPVSRGKVNPTFRSAKWHFLCTTHRIVAYPSHFQNLFTKRTYHTIWFPWNMLANIAFRHYKKGWLQIGEPRCYLWLTFALEKQVYRLAIGSFSPEQAGKHVISIANTAMGSKVKYFELAKQFSMVGSKNIPKIEETLQTLGNESKVELMPKGDGYAAKQRFFPKLHPFAFLYTLGLKPNSEKQ